MSRRASLGLPWRPPLHDRGPLSGDLDQNNCAGKLARTDQTGLPGSTLEATPERLGSPIGRSALRPHVPVKYTDKRTYDTPNGLGDGATNKNLGVQYCIIHKSKRLHGMLGLGLGVWHAWRWPGRLPCLALA